MDGHLGHIVTITSSSFSHHTAYVKVCVCILATHDSLSLDKDISGANLANLPYIMPRVIYQNNFEMKGDTLGLILFSLICNAMFRKTRFVTSEHLKSFQNRDAKTPK
ncbi:hypothetical protein ACJX0J_007946 [Zea mays]